MRVPTSRRMRDEPLRKFPGSRFVLHNSITSANTRVNCNNPGCVPEFTVPEFTRGPLSDYTGVIRGRRNSWRLPGRLYRCRTCISDMRTRVEYGLETLSPLRLPNPGRYLFPPNLRVGSAGRNCR